MNISAAAMQTGLSAKTIRYYEEIDLVTPGRGANGYRAYQERDIHKLRFLQRARSLGFSIKDCRTLLSLYEDTGRASADVKAIALSRVADIDRKIDELSSLRDILRELAEKCHGDERPDCPILDGLSMGSDDRRLS